MFSCQLVKREGENISKQTKQTKEFGETIVTIEKLLKGIVQMSAPVSELMY